MREKSHLAPLWKASYRIILYERHPSLCSYFFLAENRQKDLTFLKKIWRPPFISGFWLYMSNYLHK